MQPSTNIQQYCPGRTLPSDTEITEKIQFPEQTKIYPLDISARIEDTTLFQDRAKSQGCFYL